MNTNKIIDRLYDRISFLEDSKIMKNRIYISKAKRLIKLLSEHGIIGNKPKCKVCNDTGMEEIVVIDHEGCRDIDWIPCWICNKEKEEEKICTNCGSPWIIKTYDGHWCKWCKTEL